MSYLKSNNLNGLTGHIGFDNETRFRKNFTLAILEKSSLQFDKSNNIELVLYITKIYAFRLEILEIIL